MLFSVSMLFMSFIRQILSPSGSDCDNDSSITSWNTASTRVICVFVCYFLYRFHSFILSLTHFWRGLTNRFLSNKHTHFFSFVFSKREFISSSRLFSYRLSVSLILLLHSRHHHHSDLMVFLSFLHPVTLFSIRNRQTNVYFFCRKISWKRSWCLLLRSNVWSVFFVPFLFPFLR